MLANPLLILANPMQIQCKSCSNSIRILANPMQHLMQIQANSMQILAKPMQIQANPSESCANLIQILANALANASKSRANPDNLPKSDRILCESVDKPSKSYTNPMQILCKCYVCKSLVNTCKTYANPGQNLCNCLRFYATPCISYAIHMQILCKA